ncbi:collagen alpha-1(XV) chain-like [Manduca sexta]|uniref:collagen alpha-1(XV) chain-like n=1 Tax=Manduca sexta TaxID=7130 RepID=UPI00188F0813|nr:collagen alpha-1(XV) chain-like [Manduca sexta]
MEVTRPTPKPTLHPQQRRPYYPRYPPNAIRLGALNEPYAGRVFSYRNVNDTGLKAASHECHRQSWKFGGNFVPFLTDSVTALTSLVKHTERGLPVVNLRGELLFRSWRNLFDGSRAAFDAVSNIYSFNNKNVLIDPTWPTKAVWHGADESGNCDHNAYCKEWNREDPDLKGLGSSLHSHKLLDQELFSCDNKLIILCVEQTTSWKRRRHSSHGLRHHNRTIH